MKTLSDALKAELAGDVTRLTSCWSIVRRDGTQFHLTEHDQDLVIDGTTYTAATGFVRTALSATADVSVNNMEVTGVFDDDTITAADLRAGLFDFAEVRVFLVNWADLTLGTMALHRGYLGEVVSAPSGTFSAELRGLVQRLAQRVGDLYSVDCRADLGDSKCKVPILPDVIHRGQIYEAGDYVRVATDGSRADSRRYQDRIYRCTTGGATAGTQPCYDTTPGNSTTDGAAVFLCMDAWTRSGSVSSVTDAANLTYSLDAAEPRNVDGWFNYGVLTWESGANLGRSIEVQASTLAGAMTLWLPMEQPIAIGDRFRVYPGCDKLTGTCISKFANIVNFRGEPFVPGIDQVVQFPNAP